MNRLQNDRENGCRERQRSRDSGRGGTEGQTDSVEGFSLRGEVTFGLGATPSSLEATCSSGSALPRQPRGLLLPGCGDFLLAPLNPQNTNTPWRSDPSTDRHPVAEGTSSPLPLGGPVTDQGPPIRFLCRCSQRARVSLDPGWPETMGPEELLVGCRKLGCPRAAPARGAGERTVPWGPGTAEARVSRSGGWEWRLAAARARSADSGAFHVGHPRPVAPRGRASGGRLRVGATSSL